MGAKLWIITYEFDNQEQPYEYYCVWCVHHMKCTHRYLVQVVHMGISYKAYRWTSHMDVHHIVFIWTTNINDFL